MASLLALAVRLEATVVKYISWVLCCYQGVKGMVPIVTWHPRISKGLIVNMEISLAISANNLETSVVMIIVWEVTQLKQIGTNDLALWCYQDFQGVL